MFFRLSISAFWLFVFACASDLPTGNAGSEAAYGGRLEFKGEPLLVLSPNATAELSVRYLDAQQAPVPGKLVDFSLTGVASGASLTPASATTDDEGFATTRLRVGSMKAALEVRATADGVTPLYIEVSVHDGDATTLSVEVSYSGQRPLAIYTVTALNGKTCAQALGADLTGELVYTVPKAGGVVQFPLGSGISIAVVAWGKDETGAKLARGCTDVPADAKTGRHVVVELEDTQMHLSGPLELELELNLATPMARITDAAKRAIDTAITPSGSYTMFAEANYYLDAIAAQLAQQTATDSLSRLATMRTGTTLSASLSPALTKAGVGPKAVGTQLGTLLATRGAGLTLRTTYSAGELAAASGLSAMSADSMSALSLPLSPHASLSASFDEQRAQLMIDELELELGLGSYARALLTALGGQDAATLQSTISSASGCGDVVASWWAKSDAAGLADVSTAVAGCEQAVQKLRTAVEAALSALDDAQGMIQLHGAAQLYDRSLDDGLVDDLGPSELMGTWGNGSVLAELRAPAKTAFAY